jgi:hypothetical protein
MYKQTSFLIAATLLLSAIVTAALFTVTSAHAAANATKMMNATNSTMMGNNTKMMGNATKMMNATNATSSMPKK